MSQGRGERDRERERERERKRKRKRASEREREITRNDTPQTRPSHRLGRAASSVSSCTHGLCVTHAYATPMLLIHLALRSPYRAVLLHELWTLDERSLRLSPSLSPLSLSRARALSHSPHGARHTRACAAPTLGMTLHRCCPRFFLKDTPSQPAADGEAVIETDRTKH